MSKSKSGAILEDRPWYKNTAAVLALPVVAIGLITAVTGLWSNLFDPTPVEVNIQIIVDISEETGRNFGGVTNFSEIQRALEESLLGVSDNDNVALRTVGGGGGCGKDGTRLVESFKTGAHSHYSRILAKESPSGPRPLAVALVEATGDFNDSRRFSGKKNRIVAIITGEDTCIQVSGRPVIAAELIKSRLRATGIPTDIIVVGFRLPEVMGERLRRIVEEIGGTFRVAESAEQLSNEVRSSISAPNFSLPALNPHTSVTSPPMLKYFSAAPRDYRPPLSAQYPETSKSDATHKIESPDVHANVEPKLRFDATSTSATSSSICAVEVGSKGVKGRGFEFGVKDAESSIRTTYNRDINTTIITTIKDGEFAAQAIAETADAVATLINEMRAATPDCKAFAVGSSGIAFAKNHDALSEAVNQRVKLGGMSFVTAEEEAEYGFITAVPKRDWASAVLIDIGSANTKFSYISDGMFKVAELQLGSATLLKTVKNAPDGDEYFLYGIGLAVDSTVRPAFREMGSRIPVIMDRKRIYWGGGAAWGAATFMQPDQAGRDFVHMDKSDAVRFLRALNDETWRNYKPSTKASPKARAEFAMDSVKVTGTFSRDYLASGVSILDAFLNEVGVDGPIHFARNRHQWLLGYASAKFSVDIWSDDMREFFRSMNLSNE